MVKNIAPKTRKNDPTTSLLTEPEETAASTGRDQGLLIVDLTRGL